MQEIQTLTFTNAPADREYVFRATGTTDLSAPFKASDSNATLDTLIESLAAYSGHDVAVTGSLTTSTDADSGETLYSGTLTVTFGEADVPMLEVLGGEWQRLVVSGGDGDADYSYAGSATRTLGFTEATLQADLRDLADANYDSVIARGVSSAGAAEHSGGTVSGDGGTTNPASNARDGDIETIWSSDFTPPPYWYLIDWGAGTEKVVNRIEITNRNDPSTFAPRNFEVQASTTGAFGGEEVVLYTAPGTHTGDPGVAHTHDFANSTAYRYYRVYVTLTDTANDHCCIAEIKYYNAGGSNIAYFNLHFPYSVGDVPQGSATGTGAVASTIYDGGAAAGDVTVATTQAGSIGILPQPAISARKYIRFEQPDEWPGGVECLGIEYRYQPKPRTDENGVVLESYPWSDWIDGRTDSGGLAILREGGCGTTIEVDSCEVPPAARFEAQYKTLEDCDSDCPREDGTPQPTPFAVMRRDEDGRAQVVAGLADNDIVNVAQMQSEVADEAAAREAADLALADDLAAETAAREAADTTLTADKADKTQLLAGFWGDGSDGNVTISGTTTLSRDMFYDTLIVPDGAVLRTGNCRVHCKTLCQVDSGGLISNNGGSATSNTPTTVANVTVAAAGPGGAGGTNIGSAGTGITAVLGGAGGAGGSGGVGNGGAAGGATGPTNIMGQLRSLPQASLAMFLSLSAATGARGGGGGGGGGGDLTNPGGAGGQGGSILLINARRIINNGTLRARGGNGHTPTTGNAGGGGAGGGGVVLLNSLSYEGAGALDVSAGTPGNGNGSGAAGAAGVAGTIYNNVWS